jgi:hypothetical protein
MPAGKIESIARHYSLQRSVVMLAIAFVMVMVGVALFAMPTCREENWRCLFPR